MYVASGVRLLWSFLLMLLLVLPKFGVERMSMLLLLKMILLSKLFN